MNYIRQIKDYVPTNEQEACDKSLILKFIERNRDTVLLRENEVAHITSSGFIMNRQLDSVLFLHHNIRNTWAWTGGHADGDGDLLAVALREAHEETGLTGIEPQTNGIASLDVLVNFGHVRKSKYVSAHLHLSVAYILIADSHEKPIINPEENSDIRWFSVESVNSELFLPNDIYLYHKIIDRAKRMQCGEEI